MLYKKGSNIQGDRSIRKQKHIVSNLTSFQYILTICIHFIHLDNIYILFRYKIFFKVVCD